MSSSQIIICSQEGNVINDGKLKKLNSENKREFHICVISWNSQWAKIQFINSIICKGKKNCKQDCALWTLQAWEELLQGEMEPERGEGKGYQGHTRLFPVHLLPHLGIPGRIQDKDWTGSSSGCWVWALLWARQRAPPKTPRLFIFVGNLKYPNGRVEADMQISLSSQGSSWAPITGKNETEKCKLGLWTLFPVQFCNHHILNIAAITFMLHLGLQLIFRSIFVSAQTGCLVRARFHLVFPQLDTSNASPLHFGFASAQPKASVP